MKDEKNKTLKDLEYWIQIYELAVEKLSKQQASIEILKSAVDLVTQINEEIHDDLNVLLGGNTKVFEEIIQKRNKK
jgi:prefoldin subunit 5